MKIELLTFWHNRNYGAELQAYATVKALEQLGHQVEVLKIGVKEDASLRKRILDLIGIVTPESLKFNRFYAKYIPSSKRYSDGDAIAADMPQADLFVVGSDQVWNPELTKSSCLDYYLAFLPDHMRRISFSTSLGISRWTPDDDLTEQIGRALKKFARISVREEEGAALLKSTFDLDVDVTLDPTLLFDGFPELLTNKSNATKYVLYYALLSNNKGVALAKAIAKDLGCREVVNNNNPKLLFNRIKWNRPSIEQWYTNFAKAQFVVAESFHGTVFSIINKRQFCVVYSGTRVSRITTLLKCIGLEDRLYPTIESAQTDKPWDRQIDYAVVDEKLKKLRASSWNYLKTALMTK